MPKYFIEPSAIDNGNIHVTGETAHHLLNVLRIKPGDSAIFCCQYVDYHATFLSSVGNAKSLTAIFIVNVETYCYTEPSVFISLFQALPKGDKMELIIQKCVELGVGEIIPVLTERVVARIKDTGNKTARYQKIAESAAGQSMRGIIPVVHPACAFESAVQMRENIFTLLPHEQEQDLSLKSEVEYFADSKRINIWIGPEGGFTKKEVTVLRSMGAIPVTLGKRVLRTETAAIAAIAQVICLCDS